MDQFLDLPQTFLVYGLENDLTHEPAEVPDLLPVLLKLQLIGNILMQPFELRNDESFGTHTDITVGSTKQTVYSIVIRETNVWFMYQSLQMFY
jgi:hypothetical protein